MYKNALKTKLNEALSSVLPVVGIVLLLSLTVAPIPVSILLSFLFGAMLLVIGIMFFSLGANLAMEQIGSKMGSRITKTKKLILILLFGFFIGILITISEPDLQVLADQVESIPRNALIFSVAFGVGIFLCIALARIFFNVSLKLLFCIFYGIALIMALFISPEFLAVAFDSGGVTTGPMTVPFIMAFGVGISSIRFDKDAHDDSFGMVALCSIGPIISVMILSLIFKADGATYSEALIPSLTNSNELGKMFFDSFPQYFKEIATALLPIAICFYIFNMIALKINKQQLKKITIGLIYTYIGLVLFLTGANAGFMPAGSFLGKLLVSNNHKWIIIPIGMLIGYFIVKAEPAVYVLMRQVEDLTSGTIPGKTLLRCLSIGVSLSVGLALFRVLTGISILYFVIPGYIIALILSFFVPTLFTAIAFDSGGVASGPLTTTFLLPFAVGACIELGGNVVTDAFGVVALVAMTPLIVIQALYVFKNNKNNTSNSVFESESKFEIIEL